MRTMESGYGLCVAFVPGNRHIVVGTKEGFLELYEISSGALLEKQQAHKGAVWSLSVRPNKLGIATASADHTVK